jgi:CheY-like chemotaxis protein
MDDFGRSPRVLVVEDDNEIAQVLQRSLRLEGYEVRVSGDGEKALDEAHTFLPDLVILDLGLPKIDGLTLTIASSEQPKTATVERVWLDDPRARAGRTVPLKVLLRTYRGTEVVKTIPIEIPANASGSLSVVVADGARLDQTEQRDVRVPPQLRTVDQVIKSLNKARRNNTLYVKLVGSDAGAVVNGERLSSLPPSVLAVLEADRNGGSFNPLRSATLGEWELATEQVVSGARTLSITVSQN